jgi:hypothetical protein
LLCWWCVQVDKSKWPRGELRRENGQFNQPNQMIPDCVSLPFYGLEYKKTRTLPLGIIK